VKSLLFLITVGIVPFLCLFICPLLMIFINWACDSRSSNLLWAAAEELAPWLLAYSSEKLIWPGPRLLYGVDYSWAKVWSVSPICLAIRYWVSMESNGSIFLRFSSENPQNSL
jgi:hypothetical protein